MLLCFRCNTYVYILYPLWSAVMAVAQQEHIPDQEIWPPRLSDGCAWHLPQWAVTLTTIVYWLIGSFPPCSGLGKHLV